MAQNVHDKIADSRPSLAKRMTQNQEVAGTIMGYMNLFIGLSLRKGCPIEGITIDPIHETSPGVFGARMHFSKISNPIAKMWAPQSDFFKYAKAKATHMAIALEKNPALERFFSGMVDALDNWASHKGIPFSSIVIEDPIVTKDDYVLTFKVKRKLSIA